MHRRRKVSITFLRDIITPFTKYRTIWKQTQSSIPLSYIYKNNENKFKSLTERVQIRLVFSPVHLTSVNLRTDPFSVVLWGFLLRFGRNGVNFNIKITSSYGNGFDRTFNFTFLTQRHSAELILLTNLSIKLSFHSN